MKYRWLVLLVAVGVLTGCDATKKIVNFFSGDATQEEVQVAEEIDPQESIAESQADQPEQNVKSCADGSQPKILKGQCQGQWRIAKAKGQSICEYAWGPAIKCPEGTVSMTYASVCYGVASMPVEAPNSAETADDCSSLFELQLKSSDYELHCCSN